MSSSDQEDNNSENGNKRPSLTQEVKNDDCIKVSLPPPPLSTRPS